jgi:cyclophilin family peptidyl-prolyl cis-trans isomerase
MLTLLAVGGAIVVAALVLGFVLMSRGGGDDAADRAFSTDAQTAPDDEADGDGQATDLAATEPQGAQAEPCPAPSGDVPTPTAEPYAEPPTVDLAGVETVTAVVRTTCGDVTLDLDAAAAPTTVGNFVALAEDGYYDGVGFHRVIDGFMVQGGDPTGTGTGCLDDACQDQLPGYTFGDELGLAEEVVEESGGYPRGTLAMANAGADTNGSQFFIVQASPGYPLPAQYAVFGEVADGMDVVDRIAQGPVDGQLAVEPVRILDVDITR